MKVAGTHHDRNISVFRFTNTYTFFFEGQNRAQMMVVGLKSSSRKSSEVRLGPECVGHLPDVVEGPTRAEEGSITILSLWERPEISHVGSFGPLEASRGQTKQAVV